MDYKKLHKKIWDLMQSMHSTADQIDGLGEEFPDMAKEIDEFFERLKRVERLYLKVSVKFQTKLRVDCPEDYLADDDEILSIELEEIQVEDDGRTIIA